MNKKLSIIMAPLMAITFLASCGGGDTPEPEKSLLPIKYYNYDVDGDKETLFETISYEYYDNGLVKKETQYYPDFQETAVYEYTYDSYNNLTEAKETVIPDENEIETIITVYDNKYDEEGHLVERKTSTDDSPITREEYTYETNHKDWDTYERYSLEDDNEDILEESLSHTFDEMTGYVISEIDNDTKSHDDYTYDEYGCNTLIKVYGDSSTEPTSLIKTIDYTYYKNNPDKVLKCVDTICDKGTPESHETETYTYDSYDRLVKMELSNNEDKVCSRDVYEYVD